MPSLSYHYTEDQTADGEINSALLEEHVRAFFPNSFEEILSEEDGSVFIFFSSSILRPKLDEIVAAHNGAFALTRLKQSRYDEIDARTEELILSGFVYGGKLLSSSANSQSKWHAMFNMAQLGQVSFPLLLSSKDETQVSLPDATALFACYGAMVGTGKYHFDAGKVLKDAVLAAVDKAAVDAVVDTR